LITVLIAVFFGKGQVFPCSYHAWALPKNYAREALGNQPAPAVGFFADYPKTIFEKFPTSTMMANFIVAQSPRWSYFAELCGESSDFAAEMEVLNGQNHSTEDLRGPHP
jgi:hypothetical protein